MLNSSYISYIVFIKKKKAVGTYFYYSKIIENILIRFKIMYGHYDAVTN